MEHIDNFLADYLKEGKAPLTGQYIESSKIPQNIAKDVAKWDSYDISTDEAFEKITDHLEDQNHHTANAYLHCKKRGDKKGALICILINALHDCIGSMPMELCDLRYHTAYPKGPASRQ
jgi:hypothetical protein